MRRKHLGSDASWCAIHHPCLLFVHNDFELSHETKRLLARQVNSDGQP